LGKTSRGVELLAFPIPVLSISVVVTQPLGLNYRSACNELPSSEY